MWSLERKLAKFLGLLPHTIEANQTCFANAMRAKVLQTLLTVFDRVDYDVVEVPTSARDCSIVLLCDRAEVAQPPKDA